MIRELLTQAVQALSAGDLDAAARAIGQALQREPTNFDALHIGGVVAWQSGDPTLGQARLEQAMALRPQDPEPHFNLGCAQLKAGQHEAAALAFRSALDLQPAHVSAWNNLGTALCELGDLPSSVSAYQEAVRLQPNHAGALNNCANVHMQLGQVTSARELYEQTLRIQPEHSGALVGLAQCLLDLELNREAIDVAQRATQLLDTGAAWNLLGIALARCEQFDLAVDAYKRALMLDPQFADAHSNLASTFVVTEEGEQAERHFKEAIRLNPDHAEAWGNLAAYYELANRLDEAKAAAQAGLKVGGDSSMLLMTLAKCARRAGDPAGARALMEQLLESAAALSVKAEKELYFELGVIMDKLGDAGAAFAAFTKANQLAGQWWFSGSPPEDRFVPALGALADCAESDWIDQLAADVQLARGDKSVLKSPPVFLLGFARSGTTLMDTILGAHPAVCALEEPPTLSTVIRAMSTLGHDYPAELNALSSHDLAKLRETYFEAVEAEGGLAGDRLIIDKNPLSTAHIPLIYKLFPKAKIILAVRHPYDVVLSCFMQDFAMNAFMTHFLNVEGAAAVYVKVMSLWQAYLAVLPIDYHRIRYEDLVADESGEVARLFSFLELESGAAENFQDHAKRRGLINTPSYHQVSQPIYADARFRWKRYASQLDTVREQLRPFADYFDYPDS